MDIDEARRRLAENPPQGDPTEIKFGESLADKAARLEGLQLGEVRRELAMLVAMADTAERPKPDVINPPGHAMPGHEWRVDEHVRLDRHRPPVWIVRTVDDEEFRDCVYVAEPDRYRAHDWLDRLDFTPMSPVDARRLAMALLAAADWAEHLTAGVTRLEDRRPA